MVRGINAVAIESNVVAGIPKVHPNTVNASGRKAYEQDAHMCDLIAYEINLGTLVSLKISPPARLPDKPTLYGWTLPPIAPETVGRVRRFDTCPADRPFHCTSSAICVQRPSECGSSMPTQGKVTHTPEIDPYMAQSRETARQWKVQNVKWTQPDLVSKQARSIETSILSGDDINTACVTKGSDCKTNMAVGFSVLGVVALALIGIVIYLALRVKKADKILKTQKNE